MKVDRFCFGLGEEGERTAGASVRCTSSARRASGGTLLGTRLSILQVRDLKDSQISPERQNVVPLGFCRVLSSEFFSQGPIFLQDGSVG